MTDLEKLIAAVEAGDEWHEAQYAVFGNGTDRVTDFQQAFSGSLDAAKRLHDALLPGAHWSLAEDDDYGFCGRVFFNGWQHEHSTVASRAWLICILRALAADKQPPAGEGGG